MPEPILIHQWKVKTNHFRLIRIHEAGATVKFVIDRLVRDTLGDPVWTIEHAFKDDREGMVPCLLADALAALVLEADPALQSAHKIGGWPAVSQALRERHK